MIRLWRDDRLAYIEAAVRRFLSGDMDARTALSPRASDDAVGRLGAHVDALLNRQLETVTELREGTQVLVHEMRYPFITARNWMARARSAIADETMRLEIDRTIVQIDEAYRRAELMADVSIQIAERNNRVGFSPTRLDQVCEEAVVELDPVAQSRRQFIDPHLGLTSVLGKDHLLFVAIRNLLSNAITHSPLGTTVRIRCGEQGDGAWLEVEDQGPGMPPAIQREIDEGRSVALAPRNSRAGTLGGGHGVGLRLARAIFDRHGARMSVHGADGNVGTVVSVVWNLR